jgi:hypothetical protein
MPSDQENSVSDRGTIITEEELDLTRHDNVSQLEDGRYLVSTGGAMDGAADPATDAETADRPDPEEAANDRENDPADPLSEAEVNAWLENHFRELDAQYGLHAAAKFDDGVDRHRIVSDDVVTSFESLLLWYARNVGGGTPVEDVLGILLAESNVSVRYPIATLTGLLDRYDLDGEDSISDLLDAVADEDAVTLSGE